MAPKTTVYKCPDGTDFPVTWEDPEDEKYGWFWDQMHCPVPATPLSTEFWWDIMTGFNSAGYLTGGVVANVRMSVNGFAYGHPAPQPGDPPVREAVRLRDVATRDHRLLELWRDQYQPEVQLITRATRSLASSGLSLEELVEAFDQVHAGRKRHGELHMLAMGLTTPAASRFIDLCKQEFGPEGELIATDLMGGFYNKSVESANGLWDLAQAAKAAPAVEQLIRTSPPVDVLKQLRDVTGGPEFRERLQAYLKDYGLRTESFSELSYPTWLEDPRFPLLMIRRYMDTPDSGSPTALHHRTEEKREARLAEVAPRLSADAAKWEHFQSELRIAQQRTVLIEDHNFYIDQQGPSSTREYCMAIGRQLAQRGTIEQAGDVFYLEEAELRRVVAASLGPALNGLVAERKAERDRWMRVIPPATIGEGVVMMPPPMQRFFGPVANEPMGEGAFRGVAGSSGVVRATARLVLGLDDIDRLAPGEILVTYATAPPWTPAFAIAGGIVTDIGGTLSHCAVVAREYGIPAVVGTRVATATIQDGQLITVDGTSGIVRLED